MGYAAVIKKNVKRAFIAAGDLTKIVTLSQKTASNYDFGTMQPNTTLNAAKVLRGIVYNEKSKASSKSRDVSNTKVTKLLLISEDVPTASIYDTVVIEGVTWNIVYPYEDNGYTLTMEIVRGSNG